MGVYENEKEAKFENFINKTIILSSKRYFKKEMNVFKKEQLTIDNHENRDFLQKIISSEDFQFDIVEKSLELNNALKMLSAIEQTVIFLLFEEELSQLEAAKILEICSKSVSRIKLRALKKLKEFLKGE